MKKHNKSELKKKMVALGLAVIMACSSITFGTLSKPIQASAEVIRIEGGYYQQTIYGVVYQYQLLELGFSDGEKGLYDFKVKNSEQLSGNIILPSQVGNDEIGYASVGSVPSNAFKGNTKITSIVYPDTISYIGEDAFSGCTNLESITREGKEKIKGVLDLTKMHQIGNNAFLGCGNVAKVKFGSGLFIGKSAFKECTGLESIEYLDYNRNEELLTHFSTIKDEAFANCSKLEKIEFPKGEDWFNIYGKAFSRCSSLKELNFEIETRIMENAFEECYNLEKIVFHNLVEIREKAFVNSFSNYKSGKEKKVVFEDAATIQPYAFSGCTFLSNLEFNGEASIYDFAFEKTPVRNLEFQKDVYLGSEAFTGCSNLEEVIFEGNVAMASENSSKRGGLTGPFMECNSLKKMEFRGETSSVNLISLDKLESLVFYKNVSAVDGLLYQLPLLKELAFWNPNAKIQIEDNSENGQFSIYGMKGSNGISLAQKWADGNKKGSNYKNLISNVSINYKGKVIAGAKAEDIDLENLEVYAYYYNEPLKAVRLEQAYGKADPFGYTVMLPDIIVEGNNRYAVTYGQEMYFDNIEGIKKAVSKIKVSTKEDEELTLVEGQMVLKDKLAVLAEYNDGTMEIVTDFSIESHTIKEGKNSIQISYGGQTGILEVAGIKREPVIIQAVYTGERPLEGTKLNLRYVDVTLQYNDGSKEVITNYNFPKFNLDEDTLDLGENNITVQAKNLETTMTITTTPKSLESISASYNNAEVVEANEVLAKNIMVMAHYNNGTHEEIKHYQIKPYVLQVGSNTITICYEGKITTIIVSGIKRSLQTIEAVYIGDDLRAGSVLEKDSICLTGTYNDGTKEEIKEKETLVLENATLHMGENTIVLSYRGLQTRLKLMVTEGLSSTATPGSIIISPLPSTTPSETTASPISSATPSEITASPIPSVAPEEDSPSPQPTQTEEPAVTKKPHAPGTLMLKANIKNLGVNKSKTDTYKIITNKTITFTLQSTNMKQISYQLVAQKKTYKDSAWVLVKDNKINIKTTDKPSVLYLKYVDNNGISKVIKTNGFLIDKTVPEVKGIIDKKTYKKAVTITFKDALSGIRSALLNKKSIKSGVKIRKKGNYTLILTDRAGNKKKIKFNIRN